MLAFVRIVVGLGVLTLGRQLYWLFVAGVGFVVGITLANRLLDTPSAVVALLVALGAGLVGGLLALFLQRVAIGLAGFLGGGIFALNLIDVLQVELRPEWIPFLVGGIFGAVLVAATFDWALVVISSITGAGLIVQAVSLARPLALLLFFALIVVGIVIQASQFQRRTSGQSKRRPPNKG
jgi:hypothetical protein